MAAAKSTPSKGESTVRALAHRLFEGMLEAPPGFEPGVEVLQTSALPLGDGADRKPEARRGPHGAATLGAGGKVGAGNGIRTRDFDLGKVALYH